MLKRVPIWYDDVRHHNASIFGYSEAEAAASVSNTTRQVSSLTGSVVSPPPSVCVAVVL